MTDLLDEEFYWFWCGTEGDARIFGPYRTQATCESHANTPGCDHDHMVMAMTGRRLVQTLPSDAWYHACMFFVPSRGYEDAVVMGHFSDVPAGEKIELYDGMADLHSSRTWNSPSSAVMASTSPSARP